MLSVNSSSDKVLLSFFSFAFIRVDTKIIAKPKRNIISMQNKSPKYTNIGMNTTYQEQVNTSHNFNTTSIVVANANRLNPPKETFTFFIVLFVFLKVNVCRENPARTGDHLVPNQAFYQLNYFPI